MFSNIDAELKLVIAGNHDLDLDKDYWSKHLIYNRSMEDHKRAIEVMTGPAAQKAGIAYLEEGMYSFELRNGARFTVYASPYQPEFCDWAFPYQRDEDRFNPPPAVNQTGSSKNIAINPIPDLGAVDIIMTHGPPLGFLDEARGESLGCEHLRRAVCRARPLLHCFGHIHEGYGMEVVRWRQEGTGSGEGVQSVEDVSNSFPETLRCQGRLGEETVFVNAAVMNVKYRPVNAPWIVELDLPKRS